MRIIAGIAAGHRLQVPKGWAVRPTSDLVKQAIFNSLGERVVAARVLELFAGSGALGLESLSRGAIQVVAVERASRHSEFIRRNLDACGLPRDRFELRSQDVFPALAQLVAAGRQFDLVLADPPFGEKNLGERSRSLSQKLLDDQHLPSLLAEGGLFVLGHARRDTLSLPDGWLQIKELHHGDSMVRFLQRTISHGLAGS